MSHLCWSCIGDVMRGRTVPTDHIDTGHTRDTRCRMSGLHVTAHVEPLPKIPTGPIPKLQRDCTSTYYCCRGQCHLHAQHCLHVPHTAYRQCPPTQLSPSYLMHFRPHFEDPRPSKPQAPRTSTYTTRPATDAPLPLDTTSYGTVQSTTRHTVSLLLPPGTHLLPYHQATVSHITDPPST
jgi:hypothetical protein